VTAGKTDLWGLEFEGTLQVTDQLSLRGTFNWAASEYKDFECGFCARVIGTVDVAGNETPRFPEYSASAGAEWVDQLTAGMDYFVRTDVIYTGSAWDEAFNLAKTSDYTLVNLRGGLQGERWRAELFVTNLFDDRNYRAAARFTDFTTGTFSLNDFVTNVSPAQPRKIGIRLGYRF
jgi:iron complex outermembrane receptor protein